MDVGVDVARTVQFKIVAADKVREKMTFEWQGGHVT